MASDETGFEVTQQQGAWTVRMWWPVGPITGGPQRITVEQAEGAPARDVARGISTTVLRRLDLAGALKIAEQGAPQAQEALQGLTEVLERLGKTAGLLLKRGGVSGTYLAALATAYQGMAEMGMQAPVRWLAQLIERRPETIKGHLKQARRDGYLTTVAGKAGGELTDKTVEELKGTEYQAFAKEFEQ
ncbi:hypothetical protein [Streptomyces sp. HUAS TT7]|uniref:hypothetical protein n=1 Tax=Streptomyces sp. HUAS TT7 TaxID=3447507 RepID=UPI003F65A3D1